jgi:hypothetical protein
MNQKLSGLCRHQQHCVSKDHANQIDQLQRDLTAAKIELVNCHINQEDSILLADVALQSTLLSHSEVNI